MRKSTHISFSSKLLLFISLGLLSSCATTKYKVDKQPLYKYFETNSTFRESHTGLLVYDLEERSVLFDYNSQKHFTPASNTKLLTYFASLILMGDSIPSIKFCEKHDTLYFTGTGDPTLLNANFDYANTLEYLGSSTHQLVYVENQMADERFGPGWSWDDYPYYYSTEKSSFPIYGNTATFRMHSSSDYIQIIPSHFENSFTIKQDTVVNNYSITRKEFENEFILKFNEKPIEIDHVFPFKYSNDLFIHLLIDTLKLPVIHGVEFPACKTELFYSVPTDSVVKHILIESDNFLAEQMLLVISGQFSDTLNSKKTINFMMKYHLSELKDEIYWVDGSGLSRYNQVTPNAMVNILEKIYHKVPKKKLFTLLPESGKNGTLKTSYPQLEGKIHAKTGSMSHVYNLSGFLETNSGKTLIFSFMNNNFNVSFSELKKDMEQVLMVFMNY